MFLRQIFGLIIVTVLVCSFSCRRQGGGGEVTIALSEKFQTLDTNSVLTSTAADERVRSLIHNTLVRKNEKFEYVGELAKDFTIGDDNLTVTFTLQDNVKFHNGKPFTSTDAKYTIDSLMQAGGYKSANFFDMAPDPKDANKSVKGESRLTSIEIPDAKTLIIKVKRTSLINQLLADLVAIPIYPEGSLEQQKTAPIGTGAFKFVRFEQLNSFIELEANPDYWEGAPNIQKLHIKSISDSNALQNELQAGTVDIAANPTNFTADTFNTLNKTPNLQVVQSDGSNVRYIVFNLSSSSVNDVKIRQAIAYAINREKIIKELLDNQARIAHSILPPESWAYAETIKYGYDPEKARQLLQESGYKGDAVKLSFSSSGGAALKQYAEVIQSMLTEVGIKVELDSAENQTFLEQLAKGQFQMSTAIWAGGNQDPIFLRDLFASSETPEKKTGGRNRSRYVNTEFDKIVEEAVLSVDKATAKNLYIKAQDVVANDLPLFPLWYPANMVIANKRIGNIQINASGDWSFLKNVTVEK
jgi:peptide/nickel transport system substrate-binding protein